MSSIPPFIFTNLRNRQQYVVGLNLFFLNTGDFSTSIKILSEKRYAMSWMRHWILLDITDRFTQYYGETKEKENICLLASGEELCLPWLLLPTFPACTEGSLILRKACGQTGVDD